MENDLLRTNYYAGNVNDQLEYIRRQKKINPLAPLPMTVSMPSGPLSNGDKREKQYQYTIVNIDSRMRYYTQPIPVGVPNGNMDPITLGTSIKEKNLGILKNTASLDIGNNFYFTGVVYNKDFLSIPTKTYAGAITNIIQNTENLILTCIGHSIPSIFNVSNPFKIQLLYLDTAPDINGGIFTGYVFDANTIYVNVGVLTIGGLTGYYKTNILQQSIPGHGLLNGEIVIEKDYIGIPETLLPNNPIETIGGTKEININYPSHNMLVGEELKISDATAPYVGNYSYQFAANNQYLIVSVPSHGMTVGQVYELNLDFVDYNITVPSSSIEWISSEPTSIFVQPTKVTITTSSPHRLDIGDKIFFYQLKSNPDVNQNYQFEVITVVNPLTFEISKNALIPILGFETESDKFFGEVIDPECTFYSRMINLNYSNHQFDSGEIPILEYNGNRQNFDYLRKVDANNIKLYLTTEVPLIPEQNFPYNVKLTKARINDNLTLSNINKKTYYVEPLDANSFQLVIDYPYSFTQTYMMSSVITNITLDEQLNSVYTVKSVIDGDNLNLENTYLVNYTTNLLGVGGGNVKVNVNGGLKSNMGYNCKVNVIDPNTIISTVDNIIFDYQILQQYNFTMEYPRLDGYTISNLNKQLFTVRKKIGDQIYFLIPNSSFTTNISIGGNEIIVYRKDTTAQVNYENPNNYKVQLPRPFTFVKQVDLISTEFYMNSYIIYNGINDSFKFTITSVTASNQGYRRTFDVVIPPGSYSPLQLENYINAEMNMKFMEAWLPYKFITNYNDVIQQIKFITKIDISNGITEISAFTKYTVNDPFLVEKQLIKLDFEFSDFTFYPDRDYYIIIENAVINDIPSSQINTKHRLFKYSDSQQTYYYINFQNTQNLGNVKVGGENVNILMPFYSILAGQPDNSYFEQMTIDFSDSNLGKMLGFSESVYGETINPATDTGLNSSYLYISSAATPEKYVILTIPQLNFNNEDPFAKIRFNNVIEDNFVSGVKNFGGILKDQLTELTLKYTDYKGNPFNFNYTEHSLTLLFTEELDLLERTNESSKRGTIITSAQSPAYSYTSSQL